MVIIFPFYSLFMSAALCSSWLLFGCNFDWKEKSFINMVSLRSLPLVEMTISPCYNWKYLFSSSWYLLTSPCIIFTFSGIGFLTDEGSFLTNLFAASSYEMFNTLTAALIAQPSGAATVGFSIVYVSAPKASAIHCIIVMFPVPPPTTHRSFTLPRWFEWSLSERTCDRIRALMLTPAYFSGKLPLIMPFFLNRLYLIRYSVQWSETDKQATIYHRIIVLLRLTLKCYPDPGSDNGSL